MARASKRKRESISVQINGIDQTEHLDIIIRKTYAQTTALFHKVNALQIEVQALQQTIAEANRLWLRILERPEDRVDAAAELARERAARIEKFT